MRRGQRKPEPGVIVLDLRPFVAGVAAAARAATEAIDALVRALRPPQPPPPTPHCRRHAGHEMSCHDCVNALAGLHRVGEAA